MTLFCRLAQQEKRLAAQQAANGAAPGAAPTNVKAGAPPVKTK